MNVVLDASAVIAFLRGEPGAEVVESYVSRRTDSLFMHAINLCEVYYDFLRAFDESSAKSAITDIFRLRVRERADFDPLFGAPLAGSRPNIAEFHLRIAARWCWPANWERHSCPLIATSLNR